MTSRSSEARHVSFPDLVALLARIFEAHGCSAKVARILADNCASAERNAAESHGVFRIPGYVATLRSGWVDGRAEPVVEDAAPGMVRVDARNGFAQAALAEARPLLVEKARACGIALLAIRNSHHFAALSLDVEPFATEGFVALSVVNSMAVVAPHGASKPVYGTNPIAFAAPRAGGPPLVFDQATSMMAHGDVKIAARDGKPLPEGVGVDRDGKPTTDAKAILDGGALLAFGGHKGASIAMMIEILCAALVGGQFSSEVDWSAHPGAQTPRTGQTVIVIDPTVGAGGLAPLAARVDELVANLQAAGQPRLPGERRLAARAKAEVDGVPIAVATLHELQALAENSRA